VHGGRGSRGAAFFHRRTSNDTLQPPKRPAERSTSAPLYDWSARPSTPCIHPPPLFHTSHPSAARPAATAQLAAAAQFSAPCCTAQRALGLMLACCPERAAVLAVPHSPPTPSRAAPAHRLNLHGAEGALEERASGPLAALKRSRGFRALRQQAGRCASTQPPHSLARSEQPRGVVGALWRWVVVGGGGRTRRRRAGRCGGAGYAKRCGRGASREGAGAYLVGRGGDRSGGE